MAHYLFNLYTSDFINSSDTCHVQKYSVDTAVVARMSYGHERKSRDLIEAFSDWSEENGLLLNATKTKESVILFYAAICRGGNISKKHEARLDRLVKKADTVAGQILSIRVITTTPSTRSWRAQQAFDVANDLFLYAPGRREPGSPSSLPPSG